MNAAWTLIQGCESQVRLAPMGGVIGLDFPAVLAMAQAMDVDTALIAELLPAVEYLIAFAWRPEE